MSDFFQEISSEMQDFLWWAPARPDALVEIEQLERRLESATAELERLDRSLDQARARLTGLEHLARKLSERVETFVRVGDQEHAWKEALELDKLRNSLGSERRHFNHQRQSYQVQRTHLQQLERQLAVLRQESYFNA
jgi:DNA repair ATPase RecN